MEPILRARDNPMALRIVAGLFVLQGLLTAVDVILKSCRGHLDLNLMLLCLWIGPGLLRHSPTWRKWALAFLWLGFFSSAVLFLMALFHSPVDMKILGQVARPIPMFPVLLFSCAMFLLVLWQYRVLIRPDVKQLFAPAFVSYRLVRPRT